MASHYPEGRWFKKKEGQFWICIRHISFFTTVTITSLPVTLNMCTVEKPGFDRANCLRPGERGIGNTCSYFSITC